LNDEAMRDDLKVELDRWDPVLDSIGHEFADHKFGGSKNSGIDSGARQLGLDQPPRHRRSPRVRADRVTHVFLLGKDSVGAGGRMKRFFAGTQFLDAMNIRRNRREVKKMVSLLWLIAVALVVWGIITMVRGQVLAGLAIILVGLLVGPGGVSIFT
jgi:hypothetical protein